MKKIGLVVAVELDAVLQKYGTPISDKFHCGFRIITYNAHGNLLYVINCNVGEIYAAAATQLLISKFNVDAIVNFGVVGGLCESMSLTKTCIVKDIVHYDFGIFENGVMSVKSHNSNNFDDDDFYIHTNDKLRKIALDLYPDLKEVTCASGDKFVGDANEKRRIHNEYSADICEMESAGIALTCNLNNVPCIFIKTVSDAVSGGLDEFYIQFENASEICFDIVDSIIEKM